MKLRRQPASCSWSLDGSRPAEYSSRHRAGGDDTLSIEVSCSCLKIRRDSVPSPGREAGAVVLLLLSVKRCAAIAALSMKILAHMEYMLANWLAATGLTSLLQCRDPLPSMT